MVLAGPKLLQRSDTWPPFVLHDQKQMVLFVQYELKRRLEVLAFRAPQVVPGIFGLNRTQASILQKEITQPSLLEMKLQN